MKKTVIFLSLLLFLKSGCSCGNNEFDSKVDEGKTAITNEEYEKALEYFESALEGRRYDEEVNVLVSQTEKMIDAIKHQEIGNECKAIGLYEQVKNMDNGYDMLCQQAKERKETLKLAEKEKYDKQLKQAEQLKDKEEYEEAKELLTAIIHKTDVYKYLEGQYKKAIGMFAEIDSELAEVEQQATKEDWDKLPQVVLR